VRPRTKSSLLWGVVGGLSFLVLVQGYELIGEPGIDLGAKFGVTLVVGVVTVGVAYAVEGRFGGVGVRGASDEAENGKGRV